MTENKKTPDIRFAGFTDAWEQRKLGEVGKTFTGLSGKTKEDFGHGAGRFVTYMNVLQNSVSDPTLVDAVEIDKKQNAIQFGDVFFTTSSEVPEEVGMSSVWLEHVENTYLNSFCFGYRPVIEIDPFYLAYMLRSETVRKRIVYLAQGISRYNISKNGVMKIEVPLPQIEEQRLLGAYFKRLDALITLHQRKCEKLKNIKKSMLEKMFPREGEKFPEIRFAGFTDAWEQRKLGDKMYIKSRIGWQALTKKEYLDSGDYYLITGTDIDEASHSIDLSRCFYVSKERYEMDDKIQVHEGDIIVTKDGTIGKVAMVKGLDKPATLNSHLFVLRDLSRNLDNRFLLHILSSHIFDDFVESTKAGSTLTGMPQKTFVQFKFLAPNLEEQKSISRCIDSLDGLITLHQRKCEKLKKVKSAMLERMFV